MIVAIGHENLDFDALGSMVLARRLHPGARLVRIGGLEGRIREVVAMFADHLGILEEGEVDLGEVEKLIVCDTARAERIGPFAQLVGRVPVVVYDHHPPQSGDLPASGGAVRQLGATVTILVELLEERGLRPSPDEATLAYAGLWEDTGGFTYSSTTVADLRAGAWLLEHGANLLAVREWMRGRSDDSAREMLGQLLSEARLFEKAGLRVVLVSADTSGYVPALAPLAHTILDTYDADAIFMVLRMDTETQIIARSNGRLDVASLLGTEFDGGGHARAAFARTGLGVEAALERIEAALPAYAEPEPRLGEVMTRRVETLPSSTSAAEALLQMQRRGFGGMPVTDGEGRVIGVVRRRDLERAVRYGMGSGQISGFMRPAVVLSPDDGLSRARQALKEGGGRMVILDKKGRAAGIFTRTDLYRNSPKPAPGIEERLREGLSEGVRMVLDALAERFSEGSIYLVGGAVRDALLGEASPDADLVLEGVDPAAVARFLTSRFGGSYGVHYSFGTAHASLDLGIEVDLATAREEDYPSPGALPRVRSSTLARDLARRDFTVNAMAFRIVPRPGLLVDHYGGLQDLEKRLLRPLHPLSFVEDPSRVVRGIRLAARLGFSFSPEAEKQIEQLAALEEVPPAAASRLRRELLLLFKEPVPSAALEMAAGFGMLQKLYGLRLTDRLRQALARLESIRPEQVPEPEAYLFLLLLDCPDRTGFVERFHFPRRYLNFVDMLENPPPEPTRLREAGPALMQAFVALYPEKEGWVYRPERHLRGRDLLELGLEPGPLVGKILKEVEQARSRGEVADFEEELTLARKLIDSYGTSRLP
ncbi:CBS domain-containing protein [Oceanithermus sp.]